MGNVEFQAANPSAARLFEVVAIPLENIAAQNVRLAGGPDGDAEIARHAEEWIEAHRDLADEWLNAARAAAE